MKPKHSKSGKVYQAFRILAGLIGLSGCTHYYYVPNAHNVPMLLGKNEARLSASFCTGDEYTGGDFQSALSVTDHIGIIANGIIARGEREYKEFRLWGNGQTITNTGNGHFIEFGPGYYLPIMDKVVFETYGTTGFGQVECGHDGYASSARFQRYALQPSIGYSGRIIEVAFSTRFALLNYTDITYQRQIPDKDALYLNDLINNNLSLLIEPAFTLRLGYENVKIQGQLGFSENLSLPDFRDNINLNLGVYITISDRFRNME